MRNTAMIVDGRIDVHLITKVHSTDEVVSGVRAVMRARSVVCILYQKPVAPSSANRRMPLLAGESDILYGEPRYRVGSKRVIEIVELDPPDPAVDRLPDAQQAPAGIVDPVFVMHEHFRICVPAPREANVFDADLLQRLHRF